MLNLDNIFQPGAVAVVGASNRVGSVGNSLITNLSKSFAGQIYPINPKDALVAGMTAYPSLSAVQAPIDLMVIAIPAMGVPAILEEGGRLGIKGAIVISSGFKEVGNIDLENKLQAICERFDITLIGPNCLGVINPFFKLNASFAEAEPRAGQISFVSQSGAICTAMLDAAADMGFGFSKFISVGNKAVVGESSILDYLSQDESTAIIALYAEQLDSPEKLIRQARLLNHALKPKPMIVLKAGRSLAGAAASASHTGALASADHAYDALFRQAGIIRANGTEELFDYLKIFNNNQIVPAAHLAIVTNAGGPGVLAADALVAEGLAVAKLSDETKDLLKNILPPAASINNPIDVLGDAKADRYEAALNTILDDKEVEAVLLILTPQSTTEIAATAQVIIKAKQKSNKPMAAVFMGGGTVRDSINLLNNNGVAAYFFPETAIKALRALNDFYKISQSPLPAAVVDKIKIDKTTVAKIFSEARSSHQYSFPEAKALPILEAYGLPVLKTYIAHNADEAVQAAQAIGKKLALKIISPDILHKSDVQGVMLNVLPLEVADKFQELMLRVHQKAPEANLEGVLLMEMIEEEGIEMILGSKKDSNLGQVIMLGLGGIYIEVLQDVVFGLNPLVRSDIEKMLDSLKAQAILRGVRGAIPFDREAIIASVLSLSQLLLDFPEIMELDINPLRVFPEGRGAKVLDARLLIA